MNLPKIDLPTYDVKLPSTGQIVKIRPFLVKEEKLLLMAVESDDENEIINTTKQVINNCIIEPKIDVEKLPFFDVDYLFIALRAKSVGETVEVKFTCNNLVDGRSCDNVFPAKIDIANSEVTKPAGVVNPIELGKGVKLKMKYPSYTTMKRLLENVNVIDKQMNIIIGSVEQIINNDSVLTEKDFTKSDLTAFLENLTKEQYQKLVDYIENFPSFVVNAEAKCNKCGYEHQLVYDDFASFFD
jgi:hypothetical protein